MNFKVYFAGGGEHWCYIAVFHNLFKKLKNTYPNYTFNFVDNFSVRREEDSVNAKFGDIHMIIENIENKKYFVISYWDTIRDITMHHRVTNWDIENCVEIFATSGTHIEDRFFKQIDYPITPISYICMNITCEDIISKLDPNRIKTKVKKLPFRGYLYEFRKFLSEDDRFNIIDKTKNMLNVNQYIDEIANVNINLSLNGAGEICHRDMEILGTGTLLFRPQLKCRFHNPLIPDYHYISVDTSDISIDVHFNDHYKILADRMYEKFEEIKDDDDYIDFISKNGKKWYDENGTVEKNAEIILGLINLDKLK